MVCYFNFSPCQETLHSLSDDDIKTWIKKKRNGRVSCQFWKTPTSQKWNSSVSCLFSKTPTSPEMILGNVKESYLVENHLLKHPQWMMISSFKQDPYHTIFQFCLNLGLQCTKFDRFLKYIPRKLFNSSFSLLFMQSEQLTETHYLLGQPKQ